MLKLRNVARYSKLPSGKMMEFPGDKLRKVRLQVNTDAPTRLDLVELTGPKSEKHTFLAVVNGLQELEFIASGTVYVLPTTDGEVWWFTDDGDQIAVHNPNAVTFTKIASRRERNPELERMMMIMESRQAMRDRHLENEIAELRAKLGHDPQTGEVDVPAPVRSESADRGGSGAPAGGTEPPAAPSAEPGASADDDPA